MSTKIKPPVSYKSTLLVQVPFVYTEIVKAVLHPISGVRVVDRTYRFKYYPQCFVASDLVDWIVNYYKKTQERIISREEAVVLGENLRDAGIFAHVVDAHHFSDNYLFFRFQVTLDSKFCIENEKETQPIHIKEDVKGKKSILDFNQRTEKTTPPKSSLLSLLGLGKVKPKDGYDTNSRHSLQRQTSHSATEMSNSPLSKKRSHDSTTISSSAPIGHVQTQSFCVSSSSRSNSEKTLSRDPSGNNIPLLDDGDLRDFDLGSPSSTDLARNKLETLRLLELEGIVPVQTPRGDRPEDKLYYACLEGDLDIVMKILSDSNNATLIHSVVKGVTPLHVAATKNRHEIIEYLLTKGTNINIKDKEDRSPLHCACSSDTKSLDSVVLLLGKGAPVNEKDKYETTAFTMALRKCKFDIADTLLLFGANPNIKKSDGTTPFHEFMAKGNISALEYLLKMGNKILTNIKDSAGETPFLKAIIGNQFNSLKLYLSHFPIKPQLVTRNSRGLNFYHLCARHGLVDILLYLNQLAEDCGVKNELINSSDETPKAFRPIHYASLNGFSALLQEMTKIVGCDLNVKDSDGNTPINLAIINQRSECITILIQRDAKLNIKNNSGENALKLLAKCAK